MTVEGPVFVVEGGDVTAYRSLGSAENDLEAIDVQNNEFQIYDSAGQVLRPLAPADQVRIEESGTYRPEELRRHLVKYVRAVGSPRFGLHDDHLDSEDLPILVKAVSRAQLH
jgi:putative ubiquitin-RnfH superfamily antitoxin RatB of RatAB toxin-antitoxin module